MDGHDLWIDYPARYAHGQLDADERGAFEVHLEHCGRCRADVRLAQAPAPPPDREPGPLPLPSRTPGSAGWLMAAAALVLAFGAAGLYTRERGRRADAERAAAEALGVAATHERTAASLDSAAAAGDSLLSFVLGEDVRVAVLTPVRAAASATLFWDPPRTRLLLSAHDLPAAPAGSTYRLWSWSGADAVAIGAFEPDAEGRAVRMFELVPGLALDRIAIAVGPDSVARLGAALLNGRFGVAPR